MAAQQLEKTPKAVNDRRVCRPAVVGSQAAKSAWAVQSAAAWLIEAGFATFRSLGDDSTADLIAVRDDNVLMLKVFLTTVDLSNPASPQVVKAPALTPAQQDKGVTALLVSHDGIVALTRADMAARYKAAYQRG